MELDLLLGLAVGALVSGFVNGFAGFGTALIASGFWFLVLPPAVVPPLIVISAVAGHIVGFFRLSNTMTWGKASYLISGGVLGVPIGAAFLAVVNPVHIKTATGVLLLGYAVFQMVRPAHWKLRAGAEGLADRVVGFLSGIMGGFAGLAGPLPLIWLQLRGYTATQQRERYQPFNFLVLGLSGLAMALIGRIDMTVLYYTAISIPFTVVGVLIGLRVYIGISDRTFRNVVLGFLTVSGIAIVLQSVV